MIHKNHAVPWHLIGELAARGESVKSLSHKFNVSENRIKKRLNLALAQDGHVRSNLEIKEAGNKVKSDLVTVLQKLSADLASKSKPDSKDSVQLQRLIDSAQKLFAWPNPKPVDTSAILNAAAIIPAVNLNLIRTTPDQLRARARQITNNADNTNNDRSANSR